MDNQAGAWMKKAMTLAARGRGWVEPNPMVGCVIVRDGVELGRGYHRRFGGPHAEIEALEDARRRGHDVRGAEAFVTLEPCCHHGKTPPCTAALIDAGLSRVTAAMADPNPQMQCRGLAALRDAGIEVRVGVLEAQARQLNAPFIKRQTTGLPWVIAKWAQTIDGKIAGSTGDSKWISSGASRAMVHELRARVDAVMVGIGTVFADDPQLTARGVRIRRTARRVVVDPSLRISDTAKLMNDVSAAPVTLAVGPDASEDRRRTLIARGVELLDLPRRGDSDRLDLVHLLRHLAQTHQATNVLVEGGPTLMGTLFAQDLVDELWVFAAPRLAGDAQAPAAVTGLQCPKIADAMTLELRHVQRIGQDVLLQYSRPA